MFCHCVVIEESTMGVATACRMLCAYGGSPPEKVDC
jgi:hypothetical protein